MKLVLNASPLIFLAKVELIGLLPAMADELVIPQAVVSEIGKYKDEAYHWIQLHGKEFVREISNIPTHVNAWDLGAGESEVIAYALKHKGCTVVLDDKAARNCAQSMDIPLIGSIGLIILAKRNGIIDDAYDYLQKLKSIGFRIDKELFNSAIRMARK